MSLPAQILTTADAVGGVWRYTMDLGRALRVRGVRSTVAVMGPPPTPAQHREAREAGLDVIDRPYRLEWMDDPWRDVEQSGEWLLELEHQIKPTLVHLNGYAHAALPWRAPVMVVAHSCVRSWWRAVRGESAPSSIDRYSAAVNAGLRAAGAVVAPSAAMGAALEAEYGMPLKVRVIPNGGPASARGLSDRAVAKERMVFAAGRVWDEAKNVKALSAIASSITWPIYVAGDDRSPSGEVCAAPGVHLLGHRPPHELANWYRRASIYALPARYEPFGLSVLEAASAGCALVLGEIPSLREFWDGAAKFVPPDDHAALSSAVQQLIERPDERRAAAHVAAARARDFGIDRTADAYLQVYETLIA
ncbi:MAG TPA: glycosyltransferase family 4 protein [Vicinamibacterales bacterium]